jgi:hypothetical protein
MTREIAIAQGAHGFKLFLRGERIVIEFTIGRFKGLTKTAIPLPFVTIILEVRGLNSEIILPVSPVIPWESITFNMAGVNDSNTLLQEVIAPTVVDDELKVPDITPVL